MQRSPQAQYGIATTPGGVAGPSRGRGPWIQCMERLVDVSFHQDMTVVAIACASEAIGQESRWR